MAAVELVRSGEFGLQILWVLENLVEIWERPGIRLRPRCRLQVADRFRAVAQKILQVAILLLHFGYPRSPFLLRIAVLLYKLP